MNRYNVLSNKAQCTLRRMDQGLSDTLFDAGVRIVGYDLSKHEAENMVDELYMGGQNPLDSEEFEMYVLRHLNPGEPARAWKGRTFNPWDNPKNVPEYY